MLKHIFLLSVRAAIFAATAFTLISFPSFGSVSVVFGLITFFIAMLWSCLLAYPLLYLRKTIISSEVVYFFLCLTLGFVVGFVTPFIVFRTEFALFDGRAFKLLGLYGLCGSLASAVAWDYVRRNRLGVG